MKGVNITLIESRGFRSATFSTLEGAFITLSIRNATQSFNYNNIKAHQFEFSVMDDQTIVQIHTSKLLVFEIFLHGALRGTVLPPVPSS